MSNFTTSQVESHNNPSDLWIIIDKQVYDLTGFLNEHPGGRKVLLKVGGKDASAQFHSFHNESVLKEYGEKLRVGKVVDGSGTDATVKDYEQVRNAIKQILAKPGYDDGSFNSNP
jgi:cytochrome b involved in lipid metabolism